MEVSEVTHLVNWMIPGPTGEQHGRGHGLGGRAKTRCGGD
jgi:hypothetical protein